MTEEKVRHRDEKNPWDLILLEMLRTIRTEAVPTESDMFSNLPEEDCHDSLKAMSWTQVYVFCERLHAHILNDAGYLDRDGDWIVRIPVSAARDEFSDEINNLLGEENLSFVFENGEFRRAGRPQTQKNTSRMNAVMVEPRLERVLKHFQKAYAFFAAKAPGNENSLKEAVTAVEAAIGIVSGTRCQRTSPRKS